MPTLRAAAATPMFGQRSNEAPLAIGRPPVRPVSRRGDGSEIERIGIERRRIVHPLDHAERLGL
jgi:hypothetical protein